MKLTGPQLSRMFRAFDLVRRFRFDNCMGVFESRGICGRLAERGLMVYVGDGCDIDGEIEEEKPAHNVTEAGAQLLLARGEVSPAELAEWRVATARLVELFGTPAGGGEE